MSALQMRKIRDHLAPDNTICDLTHKIVQSGPLRVGLGLEYQEP